jgi:hypothetical protein
VRGEQLLDSRQLKPPTSGGQLLRVRGELRASAHLWALTSAALTPLSARVAVSPTPRAQGPSSEQVDAENLLGAVRDSRTVRTQAHPSKSATLSRLGEPRFHHAEGGVTEQGNSFKCVVT